NALEPAQCRIASRSTPDISRTLQSCGVRVLFVDTSKRNEKRARPCDQHTRRMITRAMTMQPEAKRGRVSHQRPLHSGFCVLTRYVGARDCRAQQFGGWNALAFSRNESTSRPISLPGVMTKLMLGSLRSFTSDRSWLTSQLILLFRVSLQKQLTTSSACC